MLALPWNGAVHCNAELAQLARRLRTDQPYTKLGMGTGYASGKDIPGYDCNALSLLRAEIGNSPTWWVNIMQQGDTTDWHIHSADRAAVYYVTAGDIEFDFGLVHCPAGTLIRFNGDMQHKVPHVTQEGERITYAFNYTDNR